MYRRKRNIRAFAVFCVLALASIAVAAPPGSLGTIPQTLKPLTDSEKRQVTEYVQYWADQLGEPRTSAGDAAKAAQKLIDPPNAGNVSSIFLSAYAREATPLLENILNGDSNFTAVQAAKVMGFLGTPDALEKLLPWCDASREDRTAVRLLASRGCQVLINRTVKDQVINERQLSSALRQLKQAAVDESNWLVLHRQFEALAAAKNETARLRQLEVFEAVVRNLERRPDETSPLMQSLTRAMSSLRDQYLNDFNVYQQQLDFGANLAPLLGRVFELANVHWEAAQPDPSAKESYEQAINISESLLSVIDHSVRAGSQSPSTNLPIAWNTGDRPRFQTDIKTWMNVLQAPPYSR